MDTRLSPASFAYLLNCQEGLNGVVEQQHPPRARSRVTVQAAPAPSRHRRSPPPGPRIKQLKMYFFPPLSQQMRSCEVGRQHNLTQQRLLVSAQPHRCWNSPQHRRAQPGAAPKAKHELCRTRGFRKRGFLSWGVRV